MTLGAMHEYAQMEESSVDQVPWYRRRVSVVCCGIFCASVVGVVCQTQISGTDQSEVDNLASVVPSMGQPVLLPWSQTPGLRLGFSPVQVGPTNINTIRMKPANAFRNPMAAQWTSGQSTKVKSLESDSSGPPPQCGLPGLVQEVKSEEELADCLQKSGMPVVLEVTTTWCGPCKMFAPIYEKMAQEYEGKARFLKVTANENKDTKSIAANFQVKGIPAFFVLNDGEVVAKERGVSSELNIRSALQQYTR